MTDENGKTVLSDKQRKKNWNKFVTRGFFMLCLIGVGVIITLVTTTKPNEDFIKSCTMADNKLTDCVANLNQQISLYTNSQQNLEVEKNLTQVFSDQAFNYGALLCSMQNMSYYASRQSNALLCYDKNLTIFQYNLTRANR